jgi:hypothetical protein
MPANRPNDEIVLQREIEAWKLRCRGWTLARIAERMGLSIEGVRKILARVEARESKRLSRHHDRVRARQNGQVEHIIELGFDAYYTSMEPRTRVIEKVGEDGETVKHTEVVAQTGDPRHLHLVLAAQAAQRDLNGLNIDPAANPSCTLADLSMEMHLEEMRERAEEHERQKATEGQCGPEPSRGDNPA